MNRTKETVNRCLNDSDALSLLLTGYMFDTLVYYSYAKKYLEDADKKWIDFRSWTAELNGNSHVQYKGK